MQTWFVQFSDQKKAAKKVTKKLKLNLLNISLPRTSNINTAYKSKLV